jgi:glycosyltransferase involved in cell wall biosynthesis
MTQTIRTLTLVSVGLAIPDEQELLTKERTDQSPRISLFGRELNSDFLDERYLANVPRYRRWFYHGRFPTIVGQAFEAYLAHRRYDVVISWAAKIAIPFAFLLTLTGKRVPLIVMDSWISKPKKAYPLKWLGPKIDRIITWSSKQRDIALRRYGLSPEKVYHIKWFTDSKFYRPMERTMDMICAVGTEMRDYSTFIHAMRGLSIPCHIAAGRVRGFLPGSVQMLSHMNLPKNITVGRKNHVELRELYARSRFVVVPLLPTDTDNGITCILESMAMGKAVICSRTEGQVDIIKEGETGIFVPQGDPVALREAIEYLWNNPDVAERMGRAGRKRVEEHFTLDRFVAEMKTIVAQVIDEVDRERTRGLPVQWKRGERLSSRPATAPE